MDLKRPVAELEREKAHKENQEKKAKYSREGIREAKVIRDLKAGDAVRKAASENLNRNSSYNQYGVQDSHRSLSQPIGQSNSQSKGPPPAKRSKFDKGRSNPAGTPQNNYSHVQGPYGGKSSGYRGPSSLSTTNKSGGLAVTPKGKVSKKPTGQGLGGINKLDDQNIASAPQYSSPGEPYRPTHTSTPYPKPPPVQKGESSWG